MTRAATHDYQRTQGPAKQKIPERGTGLLCSCSPDGLVRNSVCCMMCMMCLSRRFVFCTLEQSAETAVKESAVQRPTVYGQINQAMDVQTHEVDRHSSILDLQGAPLYHVMAFLDTKSLCNAMQVRLGQSLGCLSTRAKVLYVAGLQRLACCRFAKSQFLHASQLFKSAEPSVL